MAKKELKEAAADFAEREHKLSLTVAEKDAEKTKKQNGDFKQKSKELDTSEQSILHDAEVIQPDQITIELAGDDTTIQKEKSSIEEDLVDSIKVDTMKEESQEQTEDLKVESGPSTENAIAVQEPPAGELTKQPSPQTVCLTSEIKPSEIESKKSGIFNLSLFDGLICCGMCCMNISLSFTLNYSSMIVVLKINIQ